MIKCAQTIVATILTLLLISIVIFSTFYMINHCNKENKNFVCHDDYCFCEEVK